MGIHIPESKQFDKLYAPEARRQLMEWRDQQRAMVASQEGQAAVADQVELETQTISAE